jgi:hypothetical protein
MPDLCGVRTIARRYQGGQAGEGNMGNTQSGLFMLGVEDIRFHVAAI